MSEITLEEAAEYIKKVTPEDDPWVGSDMSVYEESETVDYIDHCIATILNAVVSGDLVTREEVVQDFCELYNTWNDECWVGQPEGVRCKVYGFFEPYYKKKLGYIDNLIRKYGTVNE